MNLRFDRMSGYGVVLTAGILACLACQAPSPGHEAPAIPTPARSAPTGSKETPMEWKGTFCPQDQPAVLVAKTQEEWAAIWTRIGKPAPQALGDKLAVAVFLGQRNTGGFGVSFREPVEENGALVVRYEELQPKGMVIQALTQPYAVRLFPATGLPVKAARVGP